MKGARERDFLLGFHEDFEDFGDAGEEKYCRDLKGQKREVAENAPRGAVRIIVKVSFGGKIKDIEQQRYADPKVHKILASPFNFFLAEPADEFFMRRIEQQNAKVEEIETRRREGPSAEEPNELHDQQENGDHADHKKKLFADFELQNPHLFEFRFDDARHNCFTIPYLFGSAIAQ